jgi:hypothetical protein
MDVRVHLQALLASRSLQSSIMVVVVGSLELWACSFSPKGVLVCHAAEYAVEKLHGA